MEFHNADRQIAEVVPFESRASYAILGPAAQYHDLHLPTPSPQIYFDNYHHPLFPAVLPLIHNYPDPLRRPYSFPQPLGPLAADKYNVLGATLHDFHYVNNNPARFFTKYMLWFLEVNDYLIQLICPSDLNEMPCEWDELQGGCPLLRLCKVKRAFPHPHLGHIPACSPEHRDSCLFVHDIDANCRSISKQLQMPPEERFCSSQLCSSVAQGHHCRWGHDLEDARARSVYHYWEHRASARAHGSIGAIKCYATGQKIAWKPLCPADLR